MKIAISGTPGSFTEEAARKYLAESKLEGEIVYAITARGAFEAVTSGKTDLSIIPIENANGGLVIENFKEMGDFMWHLEKLFGIDVHQNLITLPGVKREEITKIASQPQALAQCKFYLRREWPSTELVEYADTALAAKDLAEGKLDRTTAVIASRAAAELYKLNILEPSIQDLKFNFTSFMVISKHRG